MKACEEERKEGTCVVFKKEHFWCLVESGPMAFFTCCHCEYNVIFLLDYLFLARDALHIFAC